MPVIFGLFSWVFIEYVMHRFILHNLVQVTHIPHHEHPKDMGKLFADWKTVLSVSIVFCGVALLLLSGFTTFLLYLGVAIGYLMYEFVHYRVHHCTPKTKWMKYLRKHHLQHHYKNEKGNYSVVFPLLDNLFRTKVI